MSTVIDPLASLIAELSDSLSWAGSQPGWLKRTREQALAALQARGFPTTNDEDWRFTNVAPIVETPFAPAEDRGSKVDRALVDGAAVPEAAAQVVFVNGSYVPELSSVSSLPEGLRVERLRAVLERDGADLESRLGRVAPFDRQPFVALNTAFWTDGVLVRLRANTAIDKPVHLLFVSVPEARNPDGDGRGSAASDLANPTIAHPRVLVEVDRGSRVAVVETYVGSPGGRYLTNGVTEVAVGEQAVVDHYKIQRESEASYHVATIHAVAARNGAFNSYSVGFGGALVRNDIVVGLAGEGSQSVLVGLYTADGSRLVDNHTAIDHATPHCDSREVYKGVLAGRARAVFNGKIIVRPDAQKTDAKQTNKALLLSEDAQINTKPQLEIFANDVKCTHGAAVGQMDEDALFYLRARGIPLQEARDLLVQAFAGDVLNRLPLASIRERMETELVRQLARWGGRS